MFKKNVWIVGLLAAITMVFIGCIDAPEPPTGEIVEVFKLSDVIADVPVGDISSDTAFNAVFAGTPVAKVGGPKYEIAMEGGKKVFKVSNMTATWGEGFDLCHVSGINGGPNSGASFTVNDTIEIKGLADTGKAGVVLAVSNSSYAGPGWNSNDTDGVIDETITLSAADIGNIKGSGVGQQAIRVQYSGGGGSRQGTIIFEEIIITGMRPIGFGPEPPPPPPCNNPECRDPDCILGLPDCPNKIAKTYKVPVGTTDSFFVNLNDWATKGASTAYVQTAVLSADKIVVNFDADNQRVVFKLTDWQVAAIAGAGSVKVEFINSTASPDHSFRYHIGDAKHGGTWNYTGEPAHTAGAFSSMLDKGVLAWNAGFNGSGPVHLILNKREAGNCAVTIEAIKITITPATAVSVLSFALAAPVAGEAAVTSVSGIGFTGAVTWSPALPESGIFANGTAYSANVAIKATVGNYLGNITTATVNSAGAYYNALTQTVVVAKFPMTALPTPVPCCSAGCCDPGDCSDCSAPICCGACETEKLCSTGGVSGNGCGANPCVCVSIAWDKLADGFTGVEIVANNYLQLDGSNQLGIQKDGGTWEVVDDALVWTYGSESGDYKGLIIQVGGTSNPAAGGGSNNYWQASASFAPVLGRTYKIIVVASELDTETGCNLRIQPNGRYQEALETSLANKTELKIEHTFVQGLVSSANLTIDNHTSKKGFIIHSIKIEQIGK